MPSALSTRDLGMRLAAICKEGLRTRTELEEYRGDLLRVENNICVWKKKGGESEHIIAHYK